MSYTMRPMPNEGIEDAVRRAIERRENTGGVPLKLEFEGVVLDIPQFNPDVKFTDQVAELVESYHQKHSL